MIPLANTLPYDEQMGDIIAQCPFCGQDHVLLPLKPKDITIIQGGKKHLLVFPCCHHRVTIVDADQDYLLANCAIR
ncbi:hypothetical protein [Paenibacillus sp. 481]|uniref:hypothetical protein n=1 Tax=Paenibacillus sp. 481 TaxID=2835869 RepID=UPI001E33A7C1|nr:hypothetical protein [Paenibacillus sp. 481]UHA74653.1 hypothetical protein KIK04_06095 [Paenibacillus sp. 481]